jgi:hypothetical protein
METSNNSRNDGGEGDVVADVPVRRLMDVGRLRAAWVQWVITVITGCALAWQKSLFRKSPWFGLGLAVGMVLSGYVLGTLGGMVGGFGWLLLLPGWLLVTGGARALQTSIVHAAIHNQITGTRKTDMLLAECITVVLGIMNAAAYFNVHCGIHHRPELVATTDDDDFAFLWLLGFRPGMSKAALWRLFWQTLVSPRFHYLFLRARFKSNFLSASAPRVGAAVGWWLTVAFILYATNGWFVFALAWVLPITVCYHVAALCQFLSEHLWLHDTDENGRVQHLTKKEQATRAKQITPTRFFGDPAPAANAGVGQWAGWGLRLLFVHLPLRVAVIPTPDLVWHSVHHDKTNSDFSNVDFGGLRWATNNPYFKPVWGLGRAIDLVFDTLSQKNALPVATTDVNVNDALLGM